MNFNSHAPTGSPTAPDGPGVPGHELMFSGATVTTPAAVPVPRGHAPAGLVTATESTPFDAPLLTRVDHQERDWHLPVLTYGFDAFTPRGDDSSPLDPEATLVAFRGTLLGMSTTKRTTHICDYPRDYAPRTVRCGLCRWFETRIFRLVDAHVEALQGMRYVLHYVGRTIVPGEVNLPRYELVRSGHEVVEAYTVRKENSQPFITKPGAKVLAQAADADSEIENAYVNRATA